MFKVEYEDNRLMFFCIIYGILQHIKASVISGDGELKLQTLMYYTVELLKSSGLSVRSFMLLIDDYIKIV